MTNWTARFSIYHIRWHHMRNFRNLVFRGLDCCFCFFFQAVATLYFSSFLFLFWSFFTKQMEKHICTVNEKNLRILNESVSKPLLIVTIMLETLDDRLKQILVHFLGAVLGFLCHQPFKSVIMGLAGSTLLNPGHTHTSCHHLHQSCFTDPGDNECPVYLSHSRFGPFTLIRAHSSPGWTGWKALMKASKKLKEFQTAQRDSSQIIVNFMDVHDFAPLKVILVLFLLRVIAALSKPCHVFYDKTDQAD